MKFPYHLDMETGTPATFGVIVLQADQTLEQDFRTLFDLEGVALHHSRISMVPEVRSASLAAMEAEIPKAVALLPDIAFDGIAYGCTSASSVIGSARVAAGVQTVFPEAKVSDPLLAIQFACDHLQIKKPSLLSPYVDEVSAPLRNALTAGGIDIAAVGSFEEADDRKVARIAPEAIAQAACQLAATAESDAIVISCTNLRCLSVIPDVERETGLPVIASNPALAWHLLRRAGIECPQPQFGRLFAGPKTAG